MNKPLLSLCIPTNGVIDLVFPVLDSIYSQQVDENLFEVIVMDNGDNSEFKKLIKEYASKHFNLNYKETESKGFTNEIDSYRAAKGVFIKFINHRTKLMPGALNEFLEFIKKNEEIKPCVYFSNGVLKLKGIQEYDSFDQYVKNLSYYSSWSTGMAFWKEDFDKITDPSSFDELFPHTGILFAERNKDKYIIDNRVLLDEIEVSQTSKGRYDLFKAFAVVYPSLIENLFKDGDISKETFESVKKDNLSFLAQLYFDFVVRKHPCSYDLSSFEESSKVYYSAKMIKRAARKFGIKRGFQKLAFWKK